MPPLESPQADAFSLSFLSVIVPVMKTTRLCLLDKNTYVTAISRVVVTGEERVVERYTAKRMVSDLRKEVEPNCELFGMVYVVVTNDEHRDKVAALIHPKYRNIVPRPRPVVRSVMRQYVSMTKPTEDEVNDFEQLLKGALKGAKSGLGLPEENPAEYSYPVTPSVRNAMSCDSVRACLEQAETEGLILLGRLEAILSAMQQLDPENFDGNKAALLEAKSQEHLSVMAIEGTGRDMAISIVSPHGRIVRMSARRFELLVENYDNTRSLGEFVREIEKGDYLDIYINTKVQKGGVLARYASQTSTLSCAVVSARKGEVEDVAEFILDADAVVCTYLAVKRLRQDFMRFIALRDEVGSRIDFDPFDN